MSGPTSSINPFADLKEFHEKFGLTYSGPPRALPTDLLKFRIKFLYEEVDEYDTVADELDDHLEADLKLSDSTIAHNLEKQLDALVDLVYVALGTAYLQGFDFDEAWRRVHAANMKKERAKSDGSNSVRKSAHDVVKPKGWEPPSHLDLVANHAHKGKE